MVPRIFVVMVVFGLAWFVWHSFAHRVSRLEEYAEKERAGESKNK